MACNPFEERPLCPSNLWARAGVPSFLMRAVVVTVVFLLAGCAVGSGDSGPEPSPRPAVEVVPSAVTVEAGATVAAKVIVLNPTGKPLHKKGCLALFQVALSKSRTSPKHPVAGLGWRLCLQRFTIPVGRSEYSADFTVGNGPPGTYWLWLYQNPEDGSPLPTPEAIRIRVEQPR